MTIPDTTSSPQALLWTAFRTDPSSSEDLYLPDTHIVFLPTGAGAASEKHVRDFYKSGGFSHPKKLSVEENVIHRTVGESSAVDEVEVTVKFVSGAGGWLLPGVEPHNLEDITITFPLVICGSIVDSRIASVRYVWDNASVLKMVRLIGSRHSWPIVAETQVDALRNPSRFRLNPFGNATSTAGARAQTGISNIFSPPVSPPQIKTAQQQQQQQQVPKKGHPALTSTVFSQQQQPTSPPPSAGQQGKKGHPALTSTLFNHLKNAPQEELQQYRNNNNNDRRPLSPSTSEESLASKASSPTSPQNNDAAGAAVSPTKKGHPALTSTLFNHLKSAEFNPQHDDQGKPNSGGRGRALSGGYDDAAQQAQAMTSGPAPAVKRGYSAINSTLFNHLKDPQQQQQQQQQQPSARVARQEQPYQQQQEVETERPAGWRSDYVRPKGHPALTSTLFSQPAYVPNAAVTKPYKKTSHNIFGAPPAEKSSSAAPVPIVVEAAETYTLEPSALEAELERNEEQRQELKESVISPSELTTAEDLEKQTLELEKLKVQEELHQAQQQQQQEEEALKVEQPAEPTPALAPVVAVPAPAPASAGRRVHPNYRSTFTIGGPR
ncbi:hypothetical protein BGX29_003898 [Mortierella sp. GBA35]|nr:hypothetical protein BGX29_003898 [Mortierella sp. GBA35]